VHLVSSEKPAEEPMNDRGLPPPPPPEEEELAPKPERDEWAEDYEEHIDAQESPPRKPKKRRKWGGVIVLTVIVIFLIIWTLLSPKVIPQSGDTYLRSDEYASLSGYSGNVDTYAGNATWAVSVGGEDSTSVGVQLNLTVLVTKVFEKTSSFWFRGTGIELQNASVYDEDGTFLAKMSDEENTGFGPLATVPVSFDETGDHELYAYVKFLVYADMRIGFLPVKAVEIESEHFTIHVS
jgi:hypothetical protein